jgi:hypothetical protein
MTLPLVEPTNGKLIVIVWLRSRRRNGKQTMPDIRTLSCRKFSPLAKSKIIEVPRGSNWGPMDPDAWYRRRLSKGNAGFALEEGVVIGPGQYVRLPKH